MEWYKLSLSEIFKELESNNRGLTEEQVKARLEKIGLNILPEAKTDSFLRIFLRQFQSSIIYILLLAAIVVFALGHSVDGMVILAVLLFNAIIGSVQEGRAQNTMKALRRLVKTEATVIRSGREVVLSSEFLVPGDVILLNEGDKIPADARILEAENLKVDEASLTGESESVSKISEPIKKEKLSSAEQLNMVFKGTYVIEGKARAIIVSTGSQTVIGKISSKLEGMDTDVPLKKNIKILSRAIIVIVLSVSALVFLIGFLRGIGLVEMFSVAVAISVSAIPEGLPAVVTVVLAAGMYRMSKKNALVRKLQAVEALGQATIIAVDKTGTVTLNQMMAGRLYVGGKMYEVKGNGYEPSGEISFEGSTVEPLDHSDILLAGKISALTASASIAYSEEQKEWQRLSGDPTDAAILVFSKKVGFHKDDLEREHEKILEIPFSSNTKYHAVMNKVDGKAMLSVVGAPELLMEKSKYLWQDGEAKLFQDEDRKSAEKAILEISRLGLRVIALAVKFETPKELELDQLPELCFVGFVGIADAVRPGAKSALNDAKKAGVKVVMITGDFPETAKAIAGQVGIYEEGDRIITGKDLQEMTENELFEILPKTSVFARVAPEDKLKIIEIYRKRGEVIAMTGDGVNDVLSLAAADLGVAMGKIGTEVAKEAADIVLLDDNFGSIVSAIEEGRNIYRTLKKIILYLFSTSMGEIFTIIVAIMLGYPLPILASQIIWLNFVTDGFLVAALAFEPKEKDLLQREALKKEGRYIVDSAMFRRMIMMGLVMMFGALYLFVLYLPQGFIKASTIALTVLAVFQWFNAWNCRSEKKTIFSKESFSNPFLFIALPIVIGLQFLAVYTPFFQKILQTTPLTVRDWGVVLGVGLLIIIVEEIRKLIYSLRNKRLFFRPPEKLKPLESAGQ